MNNTTKTAAGFVLGAGLVLGADAAYAAAAHPTPESGDTLYRVKIMSEQEDGSRKLKKISPAKPLRRGEKRQIVFVESYIPPEDGNPATARKAFVGQFADIDAGYGTESWKTTSEGRNGKNKSVDNNYDGLSANGEAQIPVSDIPFIGEQRTRNGRRLPDEFTWKDAILLNAKAQYDMLGGDGKLDRLDARALVSYLPKNKIFSAGAGVAINRESVDEQKLIDNYVASLKRTTWSPVVSAALYGRNARVTGEARLFGSGKQNETISNSAMPGTSDSREVDVSTMKYLVDAMAKLGLIDVNGGFALENLDVNGMKTTDISGKLGVTVPKIWKDAHVGIEATLGNRSFDQRTNTNYQKFHAYGGWHF